MSDCSHQCKNFEVFVSMAKKLFMENIQIVIKNTGNNIISFLQCFYNDSSLRLSILARNVIPVKKIKENVREVSQYLVCRNRLKL